MATRTGSADHLLYDQLLTNVVYEKGMGEAGIAEALAPRVRSTSISSQYMKRNRDTKNANVSTKRAPGADVQTGERPAKEMVNFRCIDHALKEKIPIEMTSDMDEAELMGEREATALGILGKIFHDWEKAVYDLLWAEDTAGFQAIYGADNVTTPTNKWDSADANMKKDILNLKTRIYRACGYMPNTLLLPNDVFNVITTENNELREATKYVGDLVTVQILARYFEVQKVIVPMYLDDNPNGDNEDLMDILWSGDHVGLYYINNAQSRRKITLATTFYWDAPEAEFLSTFAGYNRGNKSEEVEVGGYLTVEEVDLSCGGVLSDVLAA